MLEFLFPWSMVAGGVLVSSPIIIHLINRMRFKRVRWAAMEFLLKSQKRNRRKLIIEQLLLLLMRCLLVALAGLILARFLGLEAFAKPQNRHHVVLFDDTASMNDQWKDERTGSTTSFKEGRRLIVEEIARNAAQAPNLQKFEVLPVTNPNNLIFRTPVLTDDTRRDLASKLNGMECTALHADLLASIQRARKMFEETPEDQNILYIVSDFRQADWSGPRRETLARELQSLSKDGIHLKLVDVAHPARKETEAGYHANLAVVRLQPEMALVAKGMQMTKFTVAVANYGPTVRENIQVKVKLNGVEQLQSSVPFPPIPAGATLEGQFQLYLNDLGVNQISASIADEDEGLSLDNVRYAVVEVRERVPVLAIDGDLANRKREDSDQFPLRMVFIPSGGFDISPGFKLDVAPPGDVEKLDLGQYPNIFLLNVADLNEKAKANLDAYVKQGGTVCFFMGDKVKPDWYNKELYADGKGLFPVPLADRPTPELTEKDRDAREEQNRADGPQLRFYFRKLPGEHRLFSDEVLRRYGETEYFKFMYVDRHFPVPRERWSPVPGQSEELLTLPNDKSIDDYKKRVQALLDRMPLGAGADGNEKVKKFRDRLLFHRDAIREALLGTSLHRLAETIDAMLNDVGDAADRTKFPNLKGEFWEQEEQKKLATDFRRTWESVRFGDPLVVEGKFGKGRSVVFLTTIGSHWNNWTSQPLYPPMLHELQRYLMSTPGDTDLPVGTPLALDLDAARYKGALKVFYKPEMRERPAGGKDDGKGDLELISAEELALSSAPKGRVQFHVNLARKPGVYVVELGTRQADGTEQREQRAYAYNIDTRAESNLLRAAREDIEQSAPAARLYTLGSDRFSDLADRPRDLSEGPWLYLAFLLLLIAEQALAVHLSFHLHGGPAAAPAPRPASA